MPLVFPADGSFVETICGIDPGSNTLGLCFMDYDIRTFEIVSITAYTHRAERFIDEESDVALTHGVRLARLVAHRNNLFECFIHYKPSVICVESPFINTFRPEAVVALVETMATIQYAAIDYDATVGFVKYPPAVVKKTIGAFATGTKTNVFDAIATTKEITKLVPVEQLKLFDEHTIDAISVAYVQLLNLRLENTNVLKKLSSFHGTRV